MTIISPIGTGLPGLPVRPGNAQHIGRRDSQQDAFGFSSLTDHQFARHAGYLAVLADGMGGMQNGVWASTEAVRMFLGAYRAKIAQEPVAAALHRAALSANDLVHAEAVRLNLVERMGSTLVAAVILGTEMHWINIGDSRVYLFDGGQLFRLSTDHNFSEVLHERVARGEMAASEAMAHPLRNALTSYVGRESPQLDGSSQSLKLHPGAWVLLCSDGLSGVLSEPEIARELHGAPQDACERLIGAVTARQLPHQDNTTIVVLHLPSVAGEVVSGYASAANGRASLLHSTRALRRQPAAWIGAGGLLGALLLSLSLLWDTVKPAAPVVPALGSVVAPIAVPIAAVGPQTGGVPPLVARAGEAAAAASASTTGAGTSAAAVGAALPVAPSRAASASHTPAPPKKRVGKTVAAGAAAAASAHSAASPTVVSPVLTPPAPPPDPAQQRDGNPQ
jgi:serine/threonine protein phosphatase PrpC